VIERLRRSPYAGPPLADQARVRVLLLRRFPYKVFYQLGDDLIRILHIRHTAREPWTPSS